MTQELVGKTALITGVSRHAGIGAAIARELAQAGASLFLTFFREHHHHSTDEPASLIAELTTAGAVVDFLELDLSKPEAPKELFRATARRFERIDILVNNAAHWEGGGIEYLNATQLDAHYAVNVRAPALLCREFERQLPANTPGRIINITSGHHGPLVNEVAYGISKAALDGLTTTLAAAFAGSGITVNGVDPGPTDTGWITDDLRTKLGNKIRRPEDTARVVRRLCGAADVTGQILCVNLEPAA
jgi:3-oxoacyl-[acyl-carrier protein] reductase